MVRQSVSYALVALLALGACSHGGSRHFGGAKPGENPPTSAPPEDPTTESPPPENPPPTNPPPGNPPGNPPTTPNNDGSLTRTSDLATGIIGRTLHIGGNVVLGLGEHTNLPLNSLGHQLDNAGHDLHNNGLSALPLVGGALAHKVEGVDGHLNGLAQVQIVSQPMVGATTPGDAQIIGVSALSQTTSTGQVATVGLLNQGSSQQPLNVSVGGAQVLGQSGPAAVSVGVLNNPPQASGPVGAITAPLTSGNPVGAITAPLTSGNPVGAITAPLTTGGTANPVSNVVSGVTGLLGRN